MSQENVDRALKLLDAVGQAVGPENVRASLGFVGSQPSSYPVNTIYLWTTPLKEEKSNE